MALRSRSVSSCKYISVQASRYSSTATTATLNLIDAATNLQVDTAVITYPSGNGSVTYNFAAPGSGADSANGGVYIIHLLENNIIQARHILVLHCDIDCCLVKLTNELIACECDCARCAKSLAKAQKIFLLLNSAKTAAETGNNDQTNIAALTRDAYNKYKKAKEICDLTCGCNC